MKLLIRNLSRETTEAELKKLFQEFGTVQKCNLVMDQATGTSKGFGFVEMQKPGPAKAAVKTLNDKVVNGQKIRVKKAETQKERHRNSSDESSNRTPFGGESGRETPPSKGLA
jgi:RNA recognition motif-containing protein